MLNNYKFINLVEALMLIAIKSPHGAVRGTDICKSLNLPERYLEPEFQNLVHTGILKSVRGPKGGYVLGREKRNITLLDIYGALEKSEKPKNLSQFALLVNEKMSGVMRTLSETNINDLLLEGREKGLLKADIEKSD